MSIENTLWPKGNDKNLLIAVGNYLEDLLNSNKSSLDELTIDSLTNINESLQIIIAPDDDKIPKAPFTLQQLYTTYQSSKNNTNTAPKNNSSDDDKKQQQQQQSNNNKPLPSNIVQRRKKFVEFVKVLTKHGFFKGCSKGSEEFNKRMEKARLQYNSRFKNMSIDSIDFLDEYDESEPMDTDNINDNKIITENDKKQAEQLKGAGNKLLGQKQYQQAIDQYTAAINKNPQNAVYYSNRAAAYTYLKNYKQAASDSRKASSIDPNYVKAYIREGLAEYEMGNYQGAHDAYSNALNKTKSTDKNWESYMEKVEVCKMKLEEQNNVQSSSKPSTSSNSSSSANNNPFAGLGGMGGMGGMPGMGGGAGGGGPDLSSLLGNLGGMDGLSNLMKNPMMRQMAEQMMKDPEAMKKMGDMVGNMQNQGGAANNNNDNNDGNDGNDVDVNDVMKDLLANPDKAQKIFSSAMKDPEVKELLQKDPSIEPLIERIKTGDYSAFIELGSKPEAMGKIKSLIKKYYK